MRILMMLTILAASGCGDGRTSTTMTVEMEDYRRFDEPLSLGYELRCERDMSEGDVATLEGSFDPLDARAVDGEPGARWVASEDAPPGNCVARIVLRDSDVEFLCAQDVEFTVMAGSPTELNIDYVDCVDVAF